MTTYFINEWAGRLRNFIVNFFASGLSDSHDVELVRKTNMLNAIGTVGILALVPMGIDAFRLGLPILGIFDFFLAIVLLTEILYLRKGKNITLVINFGIIVAGSLFFFLMLTGANEGAAYLWYFVFPLLTTFLLGSKKGVRASLILIVSTILLFIFEDFIPFTSDRSIIFKVRFLGALTVVLIFSYAFEKIRETTQGKLSHKNEQLNAKFLELENVKEKLQSSYQILDERVKERTQELTETNKLLDRELKENRVLLKEIHHRVKNNLQIISSLLYLQSRGVDNKEVQDLLTDSQNRIKSMALIHEKLYQGSDLADINFKDYLINLVSYLVRTYRVNGKEIVVNHNVEEIFLDLDVAVPCGLIITELITNAIKYAFPEDCKKAPKSENEWNPGITLSFTKLVKEKQYSLRIEDNGCGNAKEIKALNSKTLGLELVQNLVSQLEGQIEVSGNKGINYHITFSA